MTGCEKFVILHPKGIIGAEEANLIRIAFLLMMIVVIPVLVLTAWFSIKYKAGNPHAKYTPKWAGSRKIEWFIWLIPVAIIIALSTLTWIKTFELDPYKPLEDVKKPVNIQAVSLDWKWLFIYPDDNIATVNQLVVPEKTPLSFSLTSATVMTSFFIPQLGSQMYTMAGMETHLNLMAGDTGTFIGHNQEFSGKGYETMFFKTISTTSNEFGKWVSMVKESGKKLDLPAYNQLYKPSMNDTVTYFSAVEHDLFQWILKQGMSGKSGTMGDTPARMNDP